MPSYFKRRFCGSGLVYKNHEQNLSLSYCRRQFVMNCCTDGNILSFTYSLTHLMLLLKIIVDFSILGVIEMQFLCEQRNIPQTSFECPKIDLRRNSFGWQMQVKLLKFVESGVYLCSMANGTLYTSVSTFQLLFISLWSNDYLFWWLSD